MVDLLNMKRLILLCLLAFPLFSCVRERALTREMDRVEACVNERPDSALTILRQIDTTSLLKPSERARYALLYAMALDKNYIDTTDLSIIRPAIRYYTKHGTSREKALSYYYEGRILYNAKRDAEALISQTHALENALKSAPDRNTGLIYSAMSDLSSRSYCWEEAYDYLVKAKEVFFQIKDTAAANLATAKILVNLSNQGRKEEALQMADSLLGESIPSSLYASLLIQKAGLMVDTTKVDYRPALDCYIQAFQNGGKPSAKQLAQYAYALGRCGYHEESRQVFDELMHSGSRGAATAKTYKQELLADSGEYAEAYRLLRETLDSQAETVNQLITQSLFRTQRDYFKVLESEAVLKNKKQGYATAILLLSVLLVTVFLGILAYYNKKRATVKELEMERLAQSMQDALSEKEQAISNLQVEFMDLHDARFRQLERYYKDYEMARRSGAGEKDLYDKLLATIHDIEGDIEGQRYLDTLIDQKYNGIMKRLREECPDLPKQDYLLFSYTAAKFDNSTIGMLLGNISADAIHMRRSRLRKYLRSHQLPSSDDFLQILEIRS